MVTLFKQSLWAALIILIAATVMGPSKANASYGLIPPYVEIDDFLFQRYENTLTIWGQAGPTRPTLEFAILDAYNEPGQYYDIEITNTTWQQSSWEVTGIPEQFPPRGFIIVTATYSNGTVVEDSYYYDLTIPQCTEETCG